MADVHHVTRLRVRSGRARVPARSSAVVVSLTSFPARIDHAWIPVEAMLSQDHTPDRVVLVLSDEEFPERNLPRRIVRLQKRGLEILWTPRNLRQYNKLVPTRLAYPGATIITVDDDVLYEPWLVSRLLDERRAHPDTVIGHRGWEICGGPVGLAPYLDWPSATSLTPSDRVFLTGVGGVMYPPEILPVELLTDMDRAMELTPRNDDIWFWAVARVAGTPTHCLGSTSFRWLRRQNRAPKLFTANGAGGLNDQQFAQVIRHFGFDLFGTHSGVG